MPTFLELLHTLASDLANFAGPFQTTDVGTTTSLICSRFTRSTLSASQFERWYVLIEDGDQAGEMARIRDGGVAKSTGTIAVADAFTGVIQSGTTFSLYGVLPPLTDLAGTSLQSCLGKALQLIPIEDDIPFFGIASQELYGVDTDAYPWWTDDAEIIGAWRPPTTIGGLRERWVGTVGWQADGPNLSLVFPGAPWSDGDQFTVRLRRAANSILRQGGVWTDQTTETANFVSLDDETRAGVAPTVLVAKAYAYEALAEAGAPGRSSEDWQMLAARYRRRAHRMLHGGVPSDPLENVVDLKPAPVGGAQTVWAKGWSP